MQTFVGVIYSHGQRWPLREMHSVLWLHLKGAQCQLVLHGSLCRGPGFDSGVHVFSRYCPFLPHSKRSLIAHSKLFLLLELCNKDCVKFLLTHDHKVLYVVLLSITLCHYAFHPHPQRNIRHDRSLFLRRHENICQPQCSFFCPSSLFQKGYWSKQPGSLASQSFI